MNQPDRVPAYVHVRVHKPSLGPYTFDNPNICMNCGKWLNGVPIGEPCVPETGARDPRSVGDGGYGC
jgi:hypothetical protein